MDGGAWWAAVHGVASSQTRLSDFPFTFHCHALEKEMATHSSASQVALVVNKLPANAGDKETQVQSLGRENAVEEDMATHCSILA